MNIVIAGNYPQAKHFALEKGWQMREWRYVDEPVKLSGLENFTVWKVGTWAARKNIASILDILATRRGVTYA